MQTKPAVAPKVGVLEDNQEVFRFSVPVRPDYWALLVGVSEYPTIPSRSLEGPKNDVMLASRFLSEMLFSGENMTVLVDGVKQSDLPR